MFLHQNFHFSDKVKGNQQPQIQKTKNKILFEKGTIKRWTNLINIEECF